MKSEIQKTFQVAVTLCLVCSVTVSTLAVVLKDRQDRAKEEFRQQSILAAAGLWEEGENPGELFNDSITPIGIDLEDFKPEDGDLTAAKFDLGKSMRDPELHRVVPQQDDVAGLKKMERYSIVYRVPRSGPLEKIVIPIRGRGLWSTLYGFIALDVKDISNGPQSIKVAGLTYYKHGETPGLGGEVENELWRAKWPGKLVFDEQWGVKAEVSKSASTEYQVDALSGATLTSNGVTNMLKFWLGKKGFGPYLKTLASAAAPEEPNTAMLDATNAH